MKILFLFVVLVVQAGFAQGRYNLSVMEKTPLDANRFVGVDHLGHTYYIKGLTLHKQTPEGSYEFNDFQLGRAGQVDLTNPLKITFYYPDFNTVVILDNRLSEIRRVNFVQQPPFRNVANATTANDNRLWIFNLDSQQLELYNHKSGLYQELSRPLSEDYRGQQGDFNFCYLLTEEKLRLYNIYGSLLYSIPNDNFGKMALNKGRLLLQQEAQLLLVTEQLQKRIPIDTGGIVVKDFFMSDEFLYLYDGKFVHKTQLTLTPK